MVCKSEDFPGQREIWLEWAAIVLVGMRQCGVDCSNDIE